MAKERLFDLAETRGTFQIRGKVTGHDKESFYTETKTKTGKTMRRVNFGITYDVENKRNKTMYISLQGMPQENVYFSKTTKRGEKPVTEKVEWSNRFNFNKEGFRLIGNRIGVTKVVNEKGEYVNDQKIMTDFDSAKQLGDHLSDNDSVFIKGKLDYSSFTTDDGSKRNSIKLVPNQVSLCKSEINFDDEKFEPVHEFTQVIVFNEINQEMEDEKPTGRFVVTANIVNYATIQEPEFIVTNKKLANNMKKTLKAYDAIRVWGNMITSEQIDEVESDDGWGTSNKMDRQTTPAKREFIITGADPSSIDKDTYTEESIVAAKIKIKNAQDAKNDFGTADTTTDSGWGSVPSGEDNEDDDVAW